MRVLLEHGASITATCKENSNAIHYASLLGSTATLQMMFGARNVPEVNAKNSVATPLFLSCSHGHSESSLFLIDRGADVNFIGPGGNTILHRAIYGKCSLQVIETLVKKGLSVNTANDAGETPLHYACISGDTTEILSFLIKNGSNVNAKTSSGNTGLHLAANFGSASNIKILLENGASKSQQNSAGQLPLNLAEAKSFPDCISALSL